MTRPLIRALVEAGLLTAAAWAAWRWMTWVDPEHERRDKARGYWYLARTAGHVALAAGRVALHAEVQYGKAVR